MKAPDGREPPLAWRSPLLTLAEATDFSVAAMRVVAPERAPGHQGTLIAEISQCLERPLDRVLRPLVTTQNTGIFLPATGHLLHASQYAHAGSLHFCYGLQHPTNIAPGVRIQSG